ncbi:MAG TPA: hypothetical protein VD770_03095 [Coxiellaceae bacterium]|nr:hypothetical protein [Coxiellaceae bacterium]
MQNRFYIEIGLNDYIQINAKENISHNGNLVNVSEIAVDLGFAYPVYMAECAWNSCLAEVV